MDFQLTARQDNITDEAALIAVQAAVAKGRALGCAMVATVVDAGGNLVACVRPTGAFVASVGIARDKAWTAATFGLSTDDLHNAVAEPPHLHEGIASRDGVVLFGGGFPLRVDGQVIGGIGCSGGSEDQDRACAQAGMAAIGLG
jgi:uncharacterized protein GlcG (DUF336 family)